MKTQHLEVFVAAAQEKSLRATARRLGLTPPAIMRTIQELEADLGVGLMIRSVRGIELTKYGAALEIRAKQLLEDSRRARDELNQMKGQMSGQVKFGSTPEIALTILGPTLKSFRQQAPDAELSLSEERFPLAKHRLRDGSLDFLASHLLPDTLDDDLQMIPLLSSDFVVMAREGHPLASARSLSELVTAEWFVPAVHDALRFSIMAAVFAKHHLPLPRHMIQYVSLSIALALVLDTDVIGFFPSHLADRVARFGLKQIPLDDALPRIETGAIMRRDVQLTPVAQLFLSCLRSAAHAFASDAVSTHVAAP